MTSDRVAPLLENSLMNKIIHDKCAAFEERIEELEKENRMIHGIIKEYQKHTTKLELALGLTYLTICVIGAIIIAYHTPIGY